MSPGGRPKVLQVLWFLGLWAGGVLSVGAAAGVLKVLFNAILRR